MILRFCKIFIILQCCFFYTQAEHMLFNKRITLTGWVQFPKQLENPTAFTLSYKGSPILLEIDPSINKPKKGSYIIYEDQDLDELYIIITQGLKQPRNCDISCFKTSAEFPYRYFKLTRRIKLVEPTTKEINITKRYAEYWHVRELDNSKKSRSLPDNTIILYMDPSFIDSLQEESWSITDNIVKLPRILFKDTVDPKLFEDMINRSSMSFIDIMPFHKKNTKTLLVGNNRMLALPNSVTRYLS